MSWEKKVPIPQPLPAVLGYYHLIGELSKLLPQLDFIQAHFQLPLGWVSFLAPGLQLVLHSAQQMVHPVLDSFSRALTATRGHIYSEKGLGEMSEECARRVSNTQSHALELS